MKDLDKKGRTLKTKLAPPARSIESYASIRLHRKLMTAQLQ